MALRYLALIGGEQITETQARKAFLRSAISQPGMKLYVGVHDDTPLTVSDRGAVLGHLFYRPPEVRPVKEIEERLTSQVSLSHAQTLIDKFWGGYVCIIRDVDDRSFHVVRDPSGALPCLYARLPTGWVVSSDIETLVAAGLVSPRVDWNQLVRHLSSYDLRTEATCLSSISECLAGTRIRFINDDRSVTQVWSPWDHVHGDRQSTQADLADQLFGVTSQCLEAWAGVFPEILLGISGGFDSSVIATTLGRIGSRTTCLTMATDHPEGDERKYAHIAADAAALPLLERFHCLKDIDPTRSSARHLPRPVLAAFGQSEYLQKVELVRSLGAKAYFTGIGGDNVFCHLRTANPIVDRLNVEGLSPRLWETVQDVCDLTNCSVWEAVSAAISRGMRPAAYLWKSDHRLLDRPSGPMLSHAWLNAPENRSPGKAAHVAMLTRIQGTIDGFPRQDMVPMVNPLLSQPIVELCLSIPTWRWIEGGQDRSVARAAFARQLPAPLVNRRSKGGPLTFAAEIVELHRSTIRELLCEGLLADHGVIDRLAVADLLSGTTPVPADYLLRIMLLAEAEVWSRHWSGPAQ